MGSAIGQRLREMGARAVTEVKGRSAESVARVKRAGLEVIDDDDRLVGEADFVLSIVPPGIAVGVAQRFREPLSRARSKPVFAECNAIAPATVRRMASLLAATGCRFVDAGIIGGPPPAGVENASKGPRIYASGENAGLLERLRRYGLDIAVIDGPVGAASGLKMAYAGITKGVTALGAAMIARAAREGLADALRSELSRSLPDILARLQRFLPTMFAKAGRWVAEMEQIAEFIGSEQDGATIYNGAARLYEQVAAEFEAQTSSERLTALTEFSKSRP
jgi:3-hydroxyisobutyrate dehydrogenase-like beta-hydroxyacid dehydrogenase